MYKNKKVLIIDDDANFRKTLSDILSIKDYIPITVASEKEVSHIINEEKPLVALIDLKLGDISGLDILKEIKNKFSSVECIVLTGYASQSSAIDAINLGAYGYLQKPYNMEQLLLMIRRAIEKQESVKALRDREEWFRTVVNASNDGIIAIDCSGFISIFNKAAENMFLLKKNDVLKRSPDFLFPENKREEYINYIENFEAPETREIIALRNDGSIFPTELSLSKGYVRGEHFILAVIKDITEKKEAEKETKKLEKQLRQAQKMEAIGTLAGGIAHDFNNILGAILGYTELTFLDVSEGSASHRSLKRVITACHRAKDLVNQILTFSRQKEEEKKPVKIKLILKEILHLLRASLPSTIDFRASYKKNSAMIMADPTQIHQIIMNLCTNAGHAMKDRGGILFVTLEDVELGEEAFCLSQKIVPGPYVKLAVKDSGAGMEKKVMDRIFEPYFTTKEKGEGTGLGLSVVHGIVSSYGGCITVSSEPQRGTTFEVYFPAIAENVEEEKAPAISLPGGNETIFFIDDEEDIALSAGLILERVGYKVITETDSLKALEIFDSEPKRFDLLIIDWTMPKMTGLELIEKLLNIRADIPVILCSGYSDEVSVKNAKKLGIKDFLLKPVDMEVLVNDVRRVLDESR